MKSNLKKSFIWNTLGSGLNSFNSLFFLVIVTRINGINDAGIFTLSFTTAGILLVIANYSGRTYQVTETDKEVTDNEYIINRVITSVIMLLISIVFGVVNDYNNYKLTIFLLLCLFKATEAICDVFHGILQKNNRLDIVGESLFIRSLLNIIIFLVVDYFTENLILSCVSLTIVNIIILLFMDIRKSLRYKERKKQLNVKAVFKIFTFGFYTFGVTLVSNYLVNIPRYAIDANMNESFQTIYGIIVMPATVIVLMNQFVMQPLITILKEHYTEGNMQKLFKTVRKTILVTVIIGLFTIIIAYFLGIPVLNFIYDIKLDEYRIDLILILLGATIYAITCILSNIMLIARKTKVQFIIFMVVTLISYVTSYKLVDIFGFQGAAYSYVLNMLLLLIVYIVVFIKIFKKKESSKYARKNK